MPLAPLAPPPPPLANGAAPAARRTQRMVWLRTSPTHPRERVVEERAATWSGSGFSGIRATTRHVARTLAPPLEAASLPEEELAPTVARDSDTVAGRGGSRCGIGSGTRNGIRSLSSTDDLQARARMVPFVSSGARR